MKKNLLLASFLLLFITKSFSQTIAVGSYAETIARMNQLAGKSDDLSSFTQHPVNSAFNNQGDSLLQNMVASKNLLPFKLLGIQSGIKILPFTFLTDYNSKLPYGYNNGPLYPNVGYQTMVTGGIFIKAGILNIQFKPEVVHAENAQFLTFANVQANYKSGLIPFFFQVVNGIDAPERFGPFGISTARLGQSKITLEYKNVEAGISTENMWWGPGVQNSIMMSNSAPGFVHWTFNSSNPIKTIIGSFEWQLIGGVLKESGYTPYDPGPLVYASGYYAPKPVVSRYISAFTANWHPKWIDGLYLGMSGYNYLDRDATYNAKGFAKKYIPVLVLSSVSANDYTANKTGDGQDFAYAVNVRQVLSKYNAEIYFEFARNDAVLNFRDFVLQPEHSSAYTFGGSRAFVLNKSQDQFLKVALELTHLQDPDTFLLRQEPTWYIHPVTGPRDGYTNEGRYLGAGIGPGSNSLMLDVSYVKKLNQLGIRVERYAHNNDLYFYANAGTNNYVSQWVDFSTTFYANLKFKKYLISAQYVPVTVLNYEYLQNNDISNKHARLTLTYFFD